MPPRADRNGSAYVELSHEERDLMDRMKAAAGVTTDPNLIRIALWSLADHLDMEMPNGVFDLREGSGRYARKRRANPKVRQHQEPHARPVKPAADHPWRAPMSLFMEPKA